VKLQHYDIQYISTTNTIYKDKSRLTKYYFLLKNIPESFSICEPHKFESLKWVNWSEACNYLGKTDKNTLEHFFTIQNRNKRS
jgi:hypothetical protein